MNSPVQGLRVFGESGNWTFRLGDAFEILRGVKELVERRTESGRPDPDLQASNPINPQPELLV